MSLTKEERMKNKLNILRKYTGLENIKIDGLINMYIENEDIDDEDLIVEIHIDSKSDKFKETLNKLKQRELYLRDFDMVEHYQVEFKIKDEYLHDALHRFLSFE